MMDTETHSDVDSSHMFSTESFPQDDIDPNGLKLSLLPMERKIQGSSFARFKDEYDMDFLPSLNNCTSDETEQLLIQHLKVARIIFDFNDIFSDFRGKEVKRQTLRELIIFTDTLPQRFHNFKIYNYYFKMISENIFRSFPTTTDFDQATEDNENYIEASWPHLASVYEIFKSLITSDNFDIKIAENIITETFICQFIDLIDSRDNRERSALLEILFSLYIKMFDQRTFIRQYIGFIFYRQINEELNFHGIKELLELTSSVIQGFNSPIKIEHINFLTRYLLPLHQDKLLHNYFQQLKKCIISYIDKDIKLIKTVFDFLIHKFPKTPNINKILVLDEFENIFRIIPITELSKQMENILKFLIPIMADDHFQTAERALFLSRFIFTGFNDTFKAQVIKYHQQHIIKISESHWSKHIRTCSEALLKIISEERL